MIESIQRKNEEKYLKQEKVKSREKKRVVIREQFKAQDGI
jgi:hypothetical protein